MGLQFGCQIWGPILERGPELGPQLSTQIGGTNWDPKLGAKLGPQFGKIWDPKLGTQIGTPKCQWDPNWQLKCGALMLAPNLRSKCGPFGNQMWARIWNPNLESNRGTNLEPNLGGGLNFRPNLSPQFCPNSGFKFGPKCYFFLKMAPSGPLPRGIPQYPDQSGC